MKTRRCRKCNRPTPLDQFTFTKNGNKRYVCPTCVLEELQVKREKRQRRKALNFRVDPELYQTLHDNQYGRCAICGEFSPRTLHMDHDHQTGVVRELLCPLCNTGLGMFKDSIPLLKRASEYLTKHKYKQERAERERRWNKTR